MTDGLPPGIAKQLEASLSAALPGDFFQRLEVAVQRDDARRPVRDVARGALRILSLLFGFGAVVQLGLALGRPAEAADHVFMSVLLLGAAAGLRSALRRVETRGQGLHSRMALIEVAVTAVGLALVAFATERRELVIGAEPSHTLMAPAMSSIHNSADAISGITIVAAVAGIAVVMRGIWMVHRIRARREES